MKFWKFVAGVVALVVVGVWSGAPVGAEDQEAKRQLSSLVETRHWNEGARLALAKALWGEAGINACRDWDVIPWALLRRWQRVRARGNRVSFEGLVTGYSAALDPRLATPAREVMARSAGDVVEVRRVFRRRDLQALRWNSRLPSPVLRAGWEALKTHVTRWGQGLVPDVCPDAEHWDMHGTQAPRWAEPVDCGETRNVFFRPKLSSRSRTTFSLLRPRGL